MIQRSVSAGTTEKGDVLIRVSASEKDRSIEISRVPHPRFCDGIRATVLDLLNELDVHNVHVDIQDFGALNFVIEARLRAAIQEAGRAPSC